MKIIKPVNAAAPLTVVQLKKMMVKLKSVLEQEANGFSNHKGHPQVKEMYIKASAKLEVAEAIVDALNGRPSQLNILMQGV